MRLARKWLGLVAVVALIAAGVTGWWLLTSEEEAAAQPTTQTVSSGTVQQTVSASGTVRAARSEDLSFEVSGTITRVDVEEGDRVRRGDRLASVDDDALVLAREAAWSAYTAAQTQLADDVDDSASDVQLAADRAEIVAARASWQDAKEAVESASLRAPFAGTVVALDLAVGDSAQSSSAGSGSSTSGSSGSSGQSSTSSAATSSGVVTIASTDRFAVDATVAASDLDSIEEGLQVELTVSGVEETVYGTVTKIGAVAETDSSGAAAFPVTVAVTGKRKDLYAGTSAELSIIVQQRTDVLTVATRALESEDGATYVNLVVDGETQRTEVEVGETYGATTEIVSGLAAGDTVEIPGFTVPSGSGGADGSGQQQLPGGGEFPQMPEGGFPEGGFPGAEQ